VPIYGRSSRREHHVPAQPGRPRRYARGRPRRAHHGRQAARQGQAPLGAGGHIYTPKPTKLAEARIIDAWTVAGRPRLEGAIHLGLSLVVARPAGPLPQGRQPDGRRAGQAAPDRRKPDLDNALKLACDALNGRLYRDDVDIVEMTGLRYWSDDGWERTIIRAWLS
jgi:Holliday junction resolvase RusA-like endonuclease